jgi:hypothetical protein
VVRKDRCAYHRRAILEGDQVVGETLIAQAFELREMVMRKGKNTKNGPSHLDFVMAPLPSAVGCRQAKANKA